MAGAWSRIGYGRLKSMTDYEQIGGYGTPVERGEALSEPINPETITGKPVDISKEVDAVNELVEKYNSVAEYQAAREASKASTSIKTKREELYAIQESKRAPKIQIDQKIVLWSWMIGIAIAFISSAIVSFNGITAVAQFVGLSADWMAGLFFFFIELMYLLFLVAYLVLASRVDEDGVPERTWGAMLGMISFGGIAVGANGFHTFDYWNWDLTNPQMWAGVVLSVAAPIAIISASKMASRVVFAKAISL